MKQSAKNHLETLFTRYPALAGGRDALYAATEALVDCFRAGGKLLVCGNGGSAADSQHIVGELMKGFVLPRKLDAAMQGKLRQAAPKTAETLIRHLQGALPAISLVNECALSTAYANDAAPELCFAQQVLGLGQAGDVLLGISTSGNSENVLYAAHVARAKGMVVIGLSGDSGGLLKAAAHICLTVPAKATFQIQEYHLPLYHALCLALEEEFFGEE